MGRRERSASAIASTMAALAAMSAPRAALALQDQPPAAQTAHTHTDPANHWSVSYDPAWEPWPADALETTNADIRRRMPQAPFTFIAAFGRAGEPTGSYPYILVQLTPADFTRVSYDQIEKSFNARTFDSARRQATDALKDVGTGMELNTPVLDREHNRIISTVKMDVAGIGPVRGLCVGLLQLTGVVQVNCYARDTDFQTWQPAFQRFVDGVRIDEGFAYTEPLRASAPRRGRFHPAWIAAIVLLGALAGAIIFVARRRSRRTPVAAAAEEP